ncbi:hypothetical protein FQR65_LT07777 [Abscondita terminalis]|nr:hypothetical protein FQR65_LT07777 [Abscondita terminalis]
MKLTLFFLSVCFATVFGSTGMELTNPDKPDTCSSSHDLVGEMNVGENKRMSDRCVRVTCLSGGIIKYDGCGSFGIEPPCYMGNGDLSLPYPDCCPEPKC